MPHPRAYGTNARVLGRYVKELGVINLEEAIRRMTGLPAQKFNLKNRGLIKEGYFADIVIFDENEISDASEYNQPHQYSKGVKYVWVNGVLSIDQGVQNKAKKGIAIRNINN
jgi:N-acyl-D-amino-acid deacylase